MKGAALKGERLCLALLLVRDRTFTTPADGVKANEPWPKMMAETAQMHRFKKVLAMMKVEVGLTLLLEVVGSAKSSSPQQSLEFLLVEFSTSALNAEMSKCISRSFICVDL